MTHEDVTAVLPLVLHHRAQRNPGQPPPPKHPPQESKKAPADDETRSSAPPEAQERIFPVEVREARGLRMSGMNSFARGRSADVQDHPVTKPALDVVAGFTQSFRNIGTASLKGDHLVFRTPPAKTGVRFIFVVDASGSHAAQQRMRAVKGAVAALLDSSVDHKDEVAVVAFRGAKAEIVRAPCRDAAAALRVLEFLPAGGRTPLAHALELAGSLVNPASVVILLTDGRANVAFSTTDPWADALDAAQKLTCASVLVDSSVDQSTAAATDALASAMRATLIRLDDLN